MRLVQILLGMLIGLFTAGAGWSLDPRLDAGGFREEDLEIAEEIARFSIDERHAALVAAGYPEDLLEVQQIQRDAADDFAKLVAGFSRDDQEQIWDLVRYPGLVADLARGGAKSDSELEQIAQRHPEEIRSSIRSEGRERYATWVEIYALDLRAEQDFASVLSEHPADVRSAFERLRGRPELLSVLVDDVAFATRIGAAYREDPVRVEARFDALHQEVSARRSEQEESWARELEDPERRKELETAAREFAEDQGYSLDDSSGPPAVRTRVVHVDHYVNTNPYPYWFGYPTWYDYPYWYPGSIWTHVGFRFGGAPGFVSIGLPSPYFLGWYNNNYYGGHSYGHGHGPSHWNASNYYYGGRHPHHRYRSSRAYDGHRPRRFDGHRSRRDQVDGSDGRNAQDSLRSQEERLHSRPHRDTNTRIGDRDAPRARGPEGSGRFERRDRRPRTHEPQGWQRDDLRERPSTPVPGESRIERRHRSLRTREAGRDRGEHELRRDPGRPSPPDVSSGPPSRLARSERQGREGFQGSPSFDRFARSDRRGSPQRAIARPSREAVRIDPVSRGSEARRHIDRSPQLGPRSTLSGSSGGGRFRGAERFGGGGGRPGGHGRGDGR